MIARAVTGVLAFFTVVGALFVGARLPIADAPDATVTTVAVEPARLDIACPGPLETPSGGAGEDPELGGAPTDVTRATYLDGEVRAVANGQASDGVAGSAIERVGGGDITGLSAAACTAPATDQWIVAGATTVGASARLVLTNPSDVAVEATVTAYGELGELDSRQVAIGPNLQQEVILEGVVVDVSALAIRVTATGTGVVAALQDSRLEGFQPFGTDWATASVVATQLALPGIGTANADSREAMVRLVAPEGATAQLTMSTPEGSVPLPGTAALQLEPGVVVEVALPEATEGTVIISADAPVAAGAIVTRERAASAGVDGDVARELRWIAGQPVEDDNERAVVAVGYDQRVAVYSATAQTFVLTDASGSEVGSVDVGAGKTVAIPIDVEPGSLLTAPGGFAWSLVVEDGAFETSLAPVRTTIDPLEIVVDQRRYVPAP